MITGGAAGAIAGNSITISDSEFNGSAGGAGTSFSGPTTLASGGNGGLGGGSVAGGLSLGGGGGASSSGSSSTDGGAGGAVTDNKITLTQTTLNGGKGGAGGRLTGNPTAYGAAGAGGHGGGSVFGGISIGGAGGAARSTLQVGLANYTSSGGAGGHVRANNILITDSTLIGSTGDGGAGGNIAIDTTQAHASSYGGMGAGGHGGGSVFGGLSQGGAGGRGSMVDGGSGGEVTDNKITIKDTTLMGGKGGLGGGPDITAVSSVRIFSGRGHGGFGGGSVFGGFSQGAAGGGSGIDTASQANGGNGGKVMNNIINLENIKLLSTPDGGKGGTSSAQYAGSGQTSYNSGGTGITGQKGGSVFGGVSQGGSGGGASDSANGGAGGDVFDNHITISGSSVISGDIYGGLSQGGMRGQTIPDLTRSPDDGLDGIGGWAIDNTITLIGTDITIGGSIYGGRSMNGSGHDDHTKAFKDNTLNPTGYAGSVQGIFNIENYNWTLPLGVRNQDTLIDIKGTVPVNIQDTFHSVAMYNDGTQLNDGDSIIMINSVTGNSTFTNPSSKIRQGLFLVYDATLDTVGDDLVLKIVAKKDSDPTRTPGGPGGELHPTSKSYLKGRLATLATLNQGADVIVEDCRTNVFGILNGSSSRYDTGSHIKVHDLSLVLGGSKCFELESKSTVMLGAYVQHGNSNYDSYDNYGADGEVYGWGKVRYTGLGLLFHMNVADTGSKANGKTPVPATEIGSKDGLYINGTLSAGKAKTRFNSNMMDIEGIRGEYDSKSNYVAAMAGVGYAWKIDEKQMLDFYGRYSWTHLSSDSIMMGLDRLDFGSLHSSRVRIGGRYNYDYKPNVKPYVELAYAHEFSGNASGVAYNMPIDKSSLKGGTGILEVGLNIKPSASNPAWTVNMGLQGYVGQRKGAGAEVKVRYAF